MPLHIIAQTKLLDRKIYENFIIPNLWSSNVLLHIVEKRVYLLMVLC